MKLTKLVYATVDINGGYGALFDTSDGVPYGLELKGPHLRWLFEFHGESPPPDCPVVLSNSPRETALLRLVDDFLLVAASHSASGCRDQLRRLRQMRDLIAQPGRSTTAAPYLALNKKGESIADPSPSEMSDFLCAVDSAENEHGVAWLSNDQASLEWNVNGRLVFSSRQSGMKRHMFDISREDALTLWMALADGRLSALEAAPWRAGDGRDAQRGIHAKARKAQIQEDREFYDALGAERPEHRCRVDGCGRGSVNYGIHCRPHHFSSVRGAPCPFDD